MSKREQFKALTKKYAKDVLKIIDDLDVVEEVPPPPKKEEEVEEESMDWKCEGYVWEEPTKSCPGGAKSKVKSGILFNGKRRVVCKECYNARERMKNKEKREKKKERGEEEEDGGAKKKIKN